MTAVPQRPELFPGLPVSEGMLVPTDRTLPPVPLKHTSVRVSIIGPLCDTLVTQQFHNTHTRPVEALYVFPLPEDAAVTALTLTIGERVVQGEVREREQARSDYEQASAAGQGAALLEQERPNLFTVSVANIQPDEQVQVTLRFHDRVPFADGQFEFVFPTVVLPRYVPPAQAGSADAERVTATPLLPADTRDGHTLSLSLTLDAGKLTTIDCPTHPVDIEHRRGFTTVQLRETDAIPNKDFILRYRLAGDRFETATFTYRPPGEPGTLLLMLTPNAEFAPADILPRELLFVFDRSGSMSGDSIVQARNALRACLRALNPGDTFNIFPFDNRVEQFAAQPLPFTQAHVDQADAYIESIQARGGTEILAALQAALDQPRDAERLRVVVFMTDGAVGNEDQVLRELRRSLNEARVYAFGIGSAVNRFLLDKLAEVGRGSVEYIFPGQEIEDAVQRFQNRAAFPVLVDLAVDWGGARVTDIYPAPLPDLYAGQPLSVLARFHSQGQTSVRLTGRTMRGPFEQALDIELPAATPDRGAHWATLTRVWARARIDALMTHARDEPERQSRLRDEILGLALEQRLLSPYTAFVAIEAPRADHADRTAARRVMVPIHLPQGTRREAFEPPATFGAGAAALRSSGSVHFLAAAPMGAMPRERSRRAGMQDVGSAAPADAPGAPEAARPAMQAHAMADSASPPTMGAAQAQPVSYNQRSEAALRYLARTQAVNGAWGDSLVATALVLLAFLRAGHTDRAGNFRPQLARAVRWLADQAHDPAVGPAVAWAMAELARVTGVAAHAEARDAALARVTPNDDLDAACLALARDTAYQPPATAVQLSHADARSALALALQAWNDPAQARSAATSLAEHQQSGGMNAGAVVPPDLRDDATRFALTAAAAIAWRTA